jgi:cyclopropane fatty-acyl-phospholipid synthase-like methyltransferase
MTVRSTLIAAQAAEYAKHVRGGQAFFTRYRPFICPFEPLVAAVPPAARVLDIGASNGLFLYMLRAHGKLREGVGIDIAADEIFAGRGALAALGVDNIRLIIARDIPEWPSGTFDAVSMIDVMHHIPPWAQRSFFESACANVSRDGKLIYKDMCRAPTWRASANRLHDLLKAKQWIHYRAVEDIESWARAQGFQLLASQTINIYYYGHELRVFQRER